MHKRIGLVDVDSHNFPSLPLMKISAYHKARGDAVEFVSLFEHYDIVYKSKVFDFTEDKYANYNINADVIVTGGTGYKNSTIFPNEIEHIYPDYNIYPKYSNTAYGFLTRGCPRNCEFCIVTKKEGKKSVQVAEISEFWRNQKEIKLLDPNLLACTNHEKLLTDLAATNSYIDFTQGLDIRLITADIVHLLNKLKTKRLHFAWDNPKEDLTAQFTLFNKISKLSSRNQKIVYVLTNFNSTIAEDLTRVEVLKNLGYDPYIMIYNKTNAPQEIKRLARWVNNRKIFRTIEKFADYKATTPKYERLDNLTLF